MTVQPTNLVAVHPLPDDATIELPLRVVLDWFMSSDPFPLSEPAHQALLSRLDSRAHELGYDGWIDAYHEGGRRASTTAATSESLTGPDGRTSSNADAIAKKAKKAFWKEFPTTDVRQVGYGPASFDVDLGENLVATVTVDVRRAGSRHES